LPRPNEMVLRVQDGADVIEARTIDELAAQLRVRYPDDTYDRFLRSERDADAERRTAQAMEGLIEILVEAALEDLPKEQVAGPPMSDSDSGSR
jgi:hypothetical protein